MVEGAADLGWLETVARLALAGCLGGLLGLEREYDGQDAGFRTHLLVVVGSALFAVLSVGAFDDFLVPRADSNVSVDVTRIAAYVAPGIGFIGGGAILKHGGKVSGITTAASLWSAAARSAWPAASASGSVRSPSPSSPSSPSRCCSR
jgi:putative Mg2+ transporter-C (MgtC) family protein